MKINYIRWNPFLYTDTSIFSLTVSNDLEGVTKLELEKYLFSMYNKDVKFRTYKRDGGKTLKTFLYIHQNENHRKSIKESQIS
jgi:hypothetical protein